MQTVQASEVETRIRSILEDVEKGETFLVTRDGRTLARITPESEPDRERVARAIESIREIRKRTKPVSIEDLLSARDEGRK